MVNLYLHFRTYSAQIGPQERLPMKAKEINLTILNENYLIFKILFFYLSLYDMLIIELPPSLNQQFSNKTTHFSINKRIKTFVLVYLCEYKRFKPDYMDN